MEVSVVNSDTIPHKKYWRRELLKYVVQFRNGQNGDKRDTIMIVLKREEPSGGIETAWRKLCKEEFKKKPHIEQKSHELGKTILLSWE
jgi:hypothetical protein